MRSRPTLLFTVLLTLGLLLNERTLVAFLLPYHHTSAHRSPICLSASSANIRENEDQHTNTILVFPGGGIYFYWQAGVVTYLRERNYCLDRLVGASAGALTATLAATNVDYERATELAIQLAVEAGIWERSGGLQGVWGELIETWLEELLPSDACVRINEKDAFSLLVTPIPSFSKARISTFTNNQDLIQCNMASIHLPWFLNSQPWASFRDQRYIDGSFLATSSDYCPPSRDGVTTSQVVIDHKLDPTYRDMNLLSFVAAVQPETLYKMLEDGKQYARLMEAKGLFRGLAEGQSSTQ